MPGSSRAAAGSGVRADSPRLRPGSEGEESLGFTFIASDELTLVEFSVFKADLAKYRVPAGEAKVHKPVQD